MSELRKDPIVQRWVIIAAERGQRPSDFRSEALAKEVTPKACPLCPHNEDRTPPEVYALRPDGSQPDTPGWLVRVVPNKFPALQKEGEVRRRGFGLFDAMDGVGVHEVVIETPDHSADWDTMTPEHLHLVLKTYQSRLKALMQDDRFRYILIFRLSQNKNDLAMCLQLLLPSYSYGATLPTPKTSPMLYKKFG